jgi:hypothetical protein
MAPHFETLTANVAGKIRQETYMGREYVVAPLRLIVPGVLPGSKGPLLYTANEISKNVHMWNGVPLVAPNHPTVNGTPVSARHPKVMEKYGIGFVYNAKATPNLDGEGWFDKEWTRRVDSRIITALTKGTKLELSTGLFTTDHPVPEGSKDSKGVTYNAEARDHKPDHVAILTDSIGACSVASGCGLNVNQRVTPYTADSLMILNASGDDDMSKRTIWQRLGAALGLIDNELAHGDIRKALNQALQTRFGSYSTPSSVSGMMSSVSCYVVDVFDDYVVYEQYGQGQSELYKIGYTVKDDVVTLSAEAPTSVQKVTSYKSVTENVSSFHADPANTVITAQDEIIPSSESTLNTTSQGEYAMPLTAEQKTQIVNSLVANCNCSHPVPWKAKDAATLNGLPDDTLAIYDQWNKTIVGQQPSNQTPIPVSNQGGNGNPTSLGNRTALIDNAGQCWMLNPTTNHLEPMRVIATAPINNGNQNQPIPVAQPVNNGITTPTTPQVNNKPRTMQEMLQHASDEDRAVWNMAQEAVQRERDSLVQQLTANMAGDALTQATAIYAAMPVPQLRTLVSALPPRQEDHNRTPVANYFGAAGPVHTPVINEEPLLSPKYEFVLNGKK